MDLELEEALDHQTDPWDLNELSDVKKILKRTASRMVAAQRDRHRQIMLRAEAASLDHMRVELKLDHDDIDAYLAMRRAAGNNFDRMASDFKAARYKRGNDMCRNTFMAERLAVVDVPSMKHLVREMLTSKRKVESIKLGSDKETYVWVYIDLSIDHSASMLALIKPIASCLHQSEYHFMTIIYPQLHANLKMSTKLKVERMVEDRLLSEGLNIDHEASMHFHIDNEHGRDNRSLECRVRVVMSEDFASMKSPWLRSRGVRGNLGETQLIKVKDMLIAAHRIKKQASTSSTQGNAHHRRAAPHMRS